MKNVLLLGLCLILLIFPNCKQEVKPNILLITIDTLRRDRLGCYGYSLDTTPFIDQLAREGVIFKHAVTPIPLTDPSHASILTSLHPLTHRLMQNAAELNTGVETLAEVLEKNGYYTIGAVGVKHLSGEYNFSQGFDSFSDQWDPEMKDWKGTIKSFVGKFQRVAKSVNMSLEKQIANYLDKHKNQPFFIWVHYYDPHYPYIDREEIVLKVKRKQWIQYDKEVRYTDNYTGKLYRFLEEKGLTEKLVTCITADHGEQLGEHGYGSQHWDFYSETTFVPLIFHGYKIPQNKIVEELVSTMDIGVTLLDLANLHFEKPVDGIPLLKTGGKSATISNREQLIVGDPLHVRSLQFIDFPHSFILNFDFFYKSWYFSGEMEIPLPGDRFKPIPDKWLTVMHVDKSSEYEIRIIFPYTYTFEKDLNFAVVRFEIEKNHGVYAGCKLNNSKWSESFNIDDKTKTAALFFPVTAADRLTAYIGFKEGTKIADLRYTFLPKKEFSKYSRYCKEIINKNVFEGLGTLRKFKSADELYNLESDIEMNKDLLIRKKPPIKVAAEGKRKIYRFLDYYLQNAKKIIGKGKSVKELTKKEKEMLESLGYL
jgi:arylsulfatase A-like enzyme